MLLPETDAQQLLVEDGALRGVRTGDKGRGRDGPPEPGLRARRRGARAQATVLADGVQGLLTDGGARTASGSQGENPQVYALGVKEVWKVPKPLDRVIHTLGWPLRAAQEVSRVRRLVHLPDGRRPALPRPGRRARHRGRRALGARPAAALQDAPVRAPGCSRAASASAGARRRSPRAASGRSRRASSLPGAVIAGDAAGFVNVPKLKGVHYAIRSGMLAAETIYHALRDREAGLAAPGALALYDVQVRAERDLGRPLPGAQHAPGVAARAWSSAARIAGSMDVTRGAAARRPLADAPDADAEPSLLDGRRDYPAPDGELTFDKLSSVFALGQPQPRRPAGPHPHPAPGAARGRARPGPRCARRRSTRSASEAPGRPGRAAGDAVELRPVRRDHRQGRPAHGARGRQRAGVHRPVDALARLTRARRGRPRPEVTSRLRPEA